MNHLYSNVVKERDARRKEPDKKIKEADNAIKEIARGYTSEKRYKPSTSENSMWMSGAGRQKFQKRDRYNAVCYAKRRQIPCANYSLQIKDNYDG